MPTRKRKPFTQEMFDKAAKEIARRLREGEGLHSSVRVVFLEMGIPRRAEPLLQKNPEFVAARDARVRKQRLFTTFDHGQKWKEGL